MELQWESLDENEHIKERFQGYRNGLVAYHDKEDWIFPPKTAQMIEKYQVMNDEGTKPRYESKSSSPEHGGEAR